MSKLRFRDYEVPDISDAKGTIVYAIMNDITDDPEYNSFYELLNERLPHWNENGVTMAEYTPLEMDVAEKMDAFLGTLPPGSENEFNEYKKFIVNSSRDGIIIGLNGDDVSSVKKHLKSLMDIYS